MAFITKQLESLSNIAEHLFHSLANTTLLSHRLDTPRAMPDSDEEHYTTSLVNQRVLGAGLRRKRVQFVPSTGGTSSTEHPTESNGPIAEFYLSVVFGKKTPQPFAPASFTEVDATAEPGPVDAEKPAICDICKNPIISGATSVPHEKLPSHLICLPPRHSPLALDRKRKGLLILQAQGFDPDEPLGLGAARDGILFPVKMKGKQDTLGLGAKPETVDLKAKKVKVEEKKVVKKLDAGKMRKLHEEERKKAKKLAEIFYGDGDMDEYFGGKGDNAGAGLCTIAPPAEPSLDREYKKEPPTQSLSAPPHPLAAS
ncbi:hypothetical protein LTR28_010961 [Elasticomyces elasticus]|nr:hypothetical protein LTR28_010961 [Elasticomyces elasticus]